MSTPTPAPRDFARAAALYLARETNFAARYRRDAPASAWRRLEGDHWVKVPELAEVQAEVAERLEAALTAPLPPLPFRAVYAADVEPRRRWDALGNALGVPVMTADDLAACASWYEARVALAEKYLAWRHRVPADLSPVSPRQRARLLRDASSLRRAYDALLAMSALPECRYVEEPAALDFERAWLASLPRVEGASVPTAWLHRAYRQALAAADPGAAPLGATQFRRVAEAVLGKPRRNAKGERYLGISLPVSAAA